MARQFRIENSAIGRIGGPVLTLVSGGSTSARAQVAPKPQVTATDLYPSERPDTDSSTQPNPDWRHAFFERTLGLLREDIRRRAAPVLVLTSDAPQDNTLLAECVLALVGADANSVFHANPRQTFQDFLDGVCRQLNLVGSLSQGLCLPDDSFDLFWDFLRAKAEQGRHLIVVVNDAHDMPEAFLEELALLSSFTKTSARVLQIVLIGLPPLRELIQTLVKRQLIPAGCPAYTIGSLDPDANGTFIRSERSEDGLECACMCAMEPEASNGTTVESRHASRWVFTRCRPDQLNARMGRPVLITAESTGQNLQSGVVSGGLDGGGAVYVDKHLWPKRRKRRVAVAVVEAAGETTPRQVKSPPRALASCSTHGQEEGQVTRLSDLTKILKNLQSRSPGVEASALISEDGLVLASALSPELDDIRVGGMTATLLSLGTRAAAELHRGEVHEVIVRGDNGYAVMVNAGSGTLLLVLTSVDTKLGLIFFDMREAIKGIAKILTRQ
jgi:uncharacterized protein